MEEYEILDKELNNSKKGNHLPQKFFVIIYICTFGLYQIWWMYKTWNILKEKYSLDILSPIRALFSIFFFYSLINRIQDYAKDYDYPNTYNAGLFTVGFILFGFAGNLPGLLSLVSFGTLLCLLPPFLALKHALEQDPDYDYVEQESFNPRQIGLMVFFGILFALIVLVYLGESTGYLND